MTFRYNEEDIPPIRYKQVLQYFTDIKRSAQCPVCPHYGMWNFHVDAESDGSADGDPLMMFFSIPAEFPSNPELKRSMKMISLECPVCGHLEFLQAAYVLRHIKSLEKGDQQ